MKKTKIIIPALGMLLLSTAASVTGTVAWFSVNNKVEVSGMQVRTKVQSNLLIAGDTIESTAIKADSNFSSTPLEQEVLKLLEPVSTANGKNFFYTTEANADGSKIKPITGDGSTPYIAYNASTAASSDTYLNKFSEDYGITKTAAGQLVSGEQGASAYADYVFQLKATNSDAASADINLTKLDLQYSAATDGNHAYRVAIFAEEAAAPAAAVSGDAGTLKGVWKPSTGANHGGKVVDGTTSVADAVYVSAATPIATIATGVTKYYKVVVRLFLEGMDTTCTNTTFAALTGTWSLDLEFQLGSGTPVTSINMLTA